MVNEQETEKPKTIVDEARAEREAIEKATAILKAENERAERLRAEQLMAGTAGSHIEPTPVKEETPKDYVKRLERGDFNKQ